MLFVKIVNSGTPPYGHLVITANFFPVPEKRQHFLKRKTKTLMRSPVHTASGHILKSQTVETFIISPLEYSHSC